MAGAAIRFDIDGQHGRRLERLLRTAGELRPAFDEFGGWKVARIVRSFRRGSRTSRSTPGGPPMTRSGGRGLAGSMTHRPSSRQLEVGTSKVYAAVLQIGGVIRMRDKLLTVPVHPRARGKRARDFAILRYIPGRGRDRRGILARVTAAGRVTAYFTLLEQVTIRARPFLFWDQEDWQELSNIIERRFDRT